SPMNSSTCFTPLTETVLTVDSQTWPGPGGIDASHGILVVARKIRPWLSCCE
ncbi:unnamed protein product, partial [Ilex paraguariensis]